MPNKLMDVNVMLAESGFFITFVYSPNVTNYAILSNASPDGRVSLSPC